MAYIESMTKEQRASLKELLRDLYGHDGDYWVFDTVDFYERFRATCDTQDMLGYANLIYEYLRRSSSLMTKRYERLCADLLTVRQRRFAIDTSVARHKEWRLSQGGKTEPSGCVPWFPDVYKRVREAYGDTKHEELKIVCLMIMGNVTEEDGLVPVREETGILRIRDLMGVRLGQKGQSCLDIGKGKLYIGERELNVSKVFVDGLRGPRGPRGPKGDYLIGNSANDTHKYVWLCDVFDKEVGDTIADVRLSYFNWRDMTGAGHVALAEICRREGYKAVVTSEELRVGDEYAEFLNDCVVASEDSCVSEHEMIALYRAWREDVLEELEEEALGSGYTSTYVENLTGIIPDIRGDWWGLSSIEGFDEDSYGNRRY